MSSPLSKLSELFRRAILWRLASVEMKVSNLMATVEDLQNEMNSIQEGIKLVGDEVNSLLEQIKALKANDPVTQEQLDALVGQAAAIDTAIKAIPPVA